jgi:hypothetical protein
MVKYQKRGFSIRDKRAERDDGRIHFQRLRRTPRKTSRPLWWLFVLLAIVIIVLYYLNSVR